LYGELLLNLGVPVNLLDLYQLEDEKNHYVGVLTLEDTPRESLEKWIDDHWIIDSKSFSPFHVVDGQQRLTTTIVLIQCICETVGDDATLNYTSVSEIKKKFIYDSKDGGLSRSYLFGYELDNPSYNFLKAKIFNEGDNVNLPLEETIYTQNLINAKQYFLDKLIDLKTEEIEKLFKKITQHFLFAVYSMSDDIDVYITFETMNNRGKPLSHLELLKNRLIYLTTKFDTDEFERKRLRRTINQCWRAVYHQLGRNKDNPLDDDLFLFNHFILYFGKNLALDKEHSIRQLRRGYRNSFKDFLLEEKFTATSIKKNELKLEEVNTYVTSLKISVEEWYQLLNPEYGDFTDDIKHWLAKLNRQGIHPYLPLVLTFFKECQDSEIRLIFLKAIERYAFVLSLFRFNNIFGFDENHFIELASELIAKEKMPDEVIKVITSAISDNFGSNLIKLIRTNFKSNKEGFYGWHGIRYFLYEYELSLKEQSKSYSEKLNWEKFAQDDRDFKTVEHIYPQKARSKCWTEEFSSYSTKEKSALRNSLGNLVPLSTSKNSSLSNKCFDQKKTNALKTIGFNYGCLSENEVAENEKWGSTEIHYRGIKLLEFMESRWDLKLGEKNDFLNLGFLKKTKPARKK
jgi:hypothetical protein